MTRRVIVALIFGIHSVASASGSDAIQSELCAVEKAIADVKAAWPPPDPNPIKEGEIRRQFGEKVRAAEKKRSEFIEHGIPPHRGGTSFTGTLKRFAPRQIGAQRGGYSIEVQIDCATPVLFAAFFESNPTSKFESDFDALRNALRTVNEGDQVLIDGIISDETGSEDWVLARHLWKAGEYRYQTKITAIRRK
jgi:hypothetical protein